MIKKRDSSHTQTHKVFTVLSDKRSLSVLTNFLSQSLLTLSLSRRPFHPRLFVSSWLRENLSKSVIDINNRQSRVSIPLFYLNYWRGHSPFETLIETVIVSPRNGLGCHRFSIILTETFVDSVSVIFLVVFHVDYISVVGVSVFTGSDSLHHLFHSKK